MAKSFVGKIAVVLVLVSFASSSVCADDKPDDKSYSTFIKYLKSNYHAKGQGAFGMVTFARFLVKMIKPAGVKNFKISMLRDLQFTNLKVDDDLGTFIRKNVHQDWRPMTQVVSLKNNQYVYVFFAPESEDVKFLIVAVQKKDAFVIQFKFNPDHLAKFLENPEIMGISLAGDNNKNNNNAGVNTQELNTDKTNKKPEEAKKADSHELF